MSAVKLLTEDNSFIYHRRGSGMLTVDVIRSLPTAYGAPALPLSQSLKLKLAKALQEKNQQVKEAA